MLVAQIRQATFCFLAASGGEVEGLRWRPSSSFRWGSAGTGWTVDMASLEGEIDVAEDALWRKQLVKTLKKLAAALRAIVVVGWRLPYCISPNREF